eukprot:4067274-Alexandrium_andersonii.AAC.1
MAHPRVWASSTCIIADGGGDGAQGPPSVGATPQCHRASGKRRPAAPRKETAAESQPRSRTSPADK